MARTQRDIAEYFPHDAHASSKDTVTVLQSHYGNDGYAFWFKLLEKLTHTDGHYIDCRNKIKWQLLIAFLGVDEQTTVEILNLLVEMEAIDQELWESQVIWCQKLVDNLSDVYKNRKREIPRKPIISSKKGITTNSNGITTNSYTQSKVKYSKVDKTKVEYQQFIDLYHKLCPSFPRIRELSDKRKTALNNINLDELREVFEKAEASDFLSGRKGDKGAFGFDWLLNHNNRIKILEGNYDNKGWNNGRFPKGGWPTPEEL